LALLRRRFFPVRTSFYAPHPTPRPPPSSKFRIFFVLILCPVFPSPFFLPNHFLVTNPLYFTLSSR
jgi:hypothetical protein